MKFSRGVAYALQAVLQLAETGTRAPVPCYRLAVQGNMPERFLLQILRHLVAHGILESSRGVEGGYLLERDPQHISLLEVIEAVEGPLVVGLPLVAGLPEKSRDFLRQTLSQLTAEARRELEGVTLAQLLPQPSGQGDAAKGRSARSAGVGGTARPKADGGQRSPRGARKRVAANG